MKPERSPQEILDSLKSNESLRQRLRDLGEEDLFERLAAQIVTEQSGCPPAQSKAALQAALRVTFVKNELDGSAEQIEAVLKEASVQTCNGLSRLKLSDEFRGRVLDDAKQRGDLESILVTSETQDEDLLSQKTPDVVELESAWLRRFLRVKPINMERYSHLQVSAAYHARLALCCCEVLMETQPALVDVRRQMEWLELVEPMRLMIGAPQRSPHIVLDKDRFAGRSEELRRLRSFVDELESHGAMESLSRVWSRTGRLLSSRARLMMISARGGLGKSTLISKFAYDHAVMSRGMPFAYLDFDSAILQPRNPLQLLVEVARQVSLFYPRAVELETFIDNTRQSLLRNALDTPTEEGTSVEGYEPMFGMDFFHQFRRMLQELIANHSARSFLLILDTLELVQSDPIAMEGLLQFLQALTDKDFPELAIVASGRADVPELCETEGEWRTKTMVLEPLSEPDATMMVQLLGESLLSNQWVPQWSKKIAGKTRESAGREPLSLRIAVDAVRDAEPASREALVAEIAKMGEECDPESVDFVGRLYQKRILEHIADPYARQLAWPGLVARSISREVACEVLAPECGLTPEQASLAFDRLGREVWIVTPDGNDLRHRLDLRARTLPLMRRHDEALFKKICKLMSEYYLGKRPGGPSEQAEAAYYHLLGDDSGVTQLLDGESFGGVQQLLLQRLDDFAADSLVNQDLKVRQASRLLSYLDFNKLPNELAWRHLERAGNVLSAIVDPRVDPRIVKLSNSINWSSYGKLSAAEQTILIKTGRWKELLGRDFVTPENLRDLHAVSFLANFLSSITWLTCQWMSGLSQFLTSSNSKKWDWLTLVYMLLPTYRLSPELYRRIDWQLAETMPRKGALRLEWIPALRVALAFGTESLKVALQVLLKYRDVINPLGFHFSRAELEILESSSVLKGHLITSRNSRLGGFLKRNPGGPDIFETVLSVVIEAVKNIENKHSHSDRIRRDLRRFALAGSAGLASPAGYLLELSNEPLTWLRKSVSKRTPSGRRTDFVQICRQTEDEGELSSLLNSALHQVKMPAILESLELLEIISSSWNTALSEHFKPHELP